MPSISSKSVEGSSLSTISTFWMNFAYVILSDLWPDLPTFLMSAQMVTVGPQTQSAVTCFVLHTITHARMNSHTLQVLHHASLMVERNTGNDLVTAMIIKGTGILASRKVVILGIAVDMNKTHRTEAASMMVICRETDELPTHLHLMTREHVSLLISTATLRKNCDRNDVKECIRWLRLLIYCRTRIPFFLILWYVHCSDLSYAAL
mmetsp:Transcript_6466/g.10047  ORF Transcript_6466/g.10047 Transcript_6466/m.10047 type:complete len:206 (+) Transcript_6466:687-1304(+)